MGYRAVAITEHTGVTIPQWFKDKWQGQLGVPEYGKGLGFSEKYVGKPRTPIAYLHERKWHTDVLKDLQKVVAEDKEWSGGSLQMIMMHEDGKVNRLNIYADKIIIEDPTGWEEVEDVHQY